MTSPAARTIVDADEGTYVLADALEAAHLLDIANAPCCCLAHSIRRAVLRAVVTDLLELHPPVGETAR